MLFCCSPFPTPYSLQNRFIVICFGRNKNKFRYQKNRRLKHAGELITSILKYCLKGLQKKTFIILLLTFVNLFLEGEIVNGRTYIEEKSNGTLLNLFSNDIKCHLLEFDGIENGAVK